MATLDDLYIRPGLIGLAEYADHDTIRVIAQRIKMDNPEKFYKHHAPRGMFREDVFTFLKGHWGTVSAGLKATGLEYTELPDWDKMASKRVRLAIDEALRGKDVQSV